MVLRLLFVPSYSFVPTIPSASGGKQWARNMRPSPLCLSSPALPSLGKRLGQHYGLLPTAHPSVVDKESGMGGPFSPRVPSSGVFWGAPFPFPMAGRQDG